MDATYCIARRAPDGARYLALFQAISKTEADSCAPTVARSFDKLIRQVEDHEELDGLKLPNSIRGSILVSSYPEEAFRKLHQAALKGSGHLATFGEFDDLPWTRATSLKRLGLDGWSAQDFMAPSLVGDLLSLPSADSDSGGPGEEGASLSGAGPSLADQLEEQTQLVSELRTAIGFLRDDANSSEGPRLSIDNTELVGKAQERSENMGWPHKLAALDVKKKASARLGHALAFISEMDKSNYVEWSELESPADRATFAIQEVIQWLHSEMVSCGMPIGSSAEVTDAVLAFFTTLADMGPEEKLAFYSAAALDSLGSATDAQKDFLESIVGPGFTS
jgi:hypothetical protein